MNATIYKKRRPGITGTALFVLLSEALGDKVGLMKGSEVPRSIRLEQESVEAKSYPDLVEKYKTFKDSVGFDAGVIYHPCGAADVSPSEVFSGSRVIYADIDDMAMDALRKAGFEAHTEDVTRFDPGSIDVLILLNPQIPPDVPASHVNSGGYVLCNEYHGTASAMHSNSDFELIGLIRSEQSKYVFDTEQLQNCWKEIDTEEEFQASYLNTMAPNVIGRIEQEIGAKIPGERMLDQYKNAIQMIRDGKVTGTWQDISGNLVRSEDALAVFAAFPRKKDIDTNDYFVFRKKSDTLTQRTG